MKIVTLALNPLDPETWTTHEVNDVREFLVEQFAEWPSTARIYNEQVSSATDVTPSCEAEVERLGKLDGPFYVVVFPAEPITIIYAIVAIIVVAAVVMAAQQPPTPTLRNTQSQSPNNELSERSNKPRPNARIPDIFGTVRSTPDLIAVPYKLFINNEEVEYSYMCVGRGYYDVDELEIRDDTTRAIDIAGTSVEVYAPFTSPNSGNGPQLRIGTAINTPVLNVVRSNAVNGQVLRAPNDQFLRGSNNIRFSTPNEIQLNPSAGLDFTDKFAAGDSLTVSGAAEYDSYETETRNITAYSAGYFRFEIASSTLPSLYEAGKECVLTGALFSVTDSDGFWSTSYDLSGIYQIASVALESATITPEFGSPYTQYYCRVNLVSPATVNPKWSEANGTASTSAAIRIPNGAEIYNLSGTYDVLSVSDTVVTLSNPSAVNPAWGTITTTAYISPTLSTTGAKWVGPFVLDKTDLSQVFGNFVALQGLYKDDGKNQQRFDVVCEIELTPINADGSPRGAAETFQTTIEGSATYRSTRASTLKADPTFTGRCRVRARRVTPSDLAFEGSVVDEIKWRDVYSVSPISETHFGNVTTVQAVTYATSGALALKERKLNMLVTRRLPVRVVGSTFTQELYATNDAAEIISAICLDRYIGNRNVAEIDFDSIYDSVEEVKAYFESDLAGEFCYTFDSDNLSFEETVKSVADSVFCTAYRRGNIIKLSFEKETQDSTLLFNHRNKLPGSETRTVRFGNQDNFDGVSFQYTDPNDDALVTYYIPEDRSAANPKEVESLGVRNGLQAYFHAWRIWNKIRYQNVITEFTATAEADLLVRNDRILVANNTRPDTQDGEVLSQNVLQLTLSQNVDMTKYAEYTIFLQLTDGTIESIAVTPGATARQVVLAHAPRLPLALDDDLYARTTFMLVGNTEPRENAFLVSEKTSQSNFTSVVRAVNYDSRYYANDKDFSTGLINESGQYV